MIFLETSSNAKDDAEDSMLLLLLLSFVLFFSNKDKDREETEGTGDLLRSGGVGGEKHGDALALTSDVVLLWGDS
jgi:hypothetical protein